MNFICYVCGRQIDFDDAVVDHIAPHSNGGKTDLDNANRLLIL